MKKFKIAVAGTGYVGLSLSVLLAQHNQVMAVDIVQAKVDMINNHKELHQRLEEHKNLKKLIQKNSGRSKLQSKETTTKREIEQVMGNVVRLESQKRSGYEQYVLGRLSKEKFLELKQGLENEIVTLKQSKSAKEKELAIIQKELQQKKQTAGNTEVLLTADNLQQYVKKIEVDRRKITYTEFVF